MFATGDEIPDDEALAAAAARRIEAGARGEALTSAAPAAHRTAEALGLTATVEPALRDLDVGRWRGKSLTDIAAGELAAWIADPDCAEHGGESVAMLVARVEAFLAIKLAGGHVVAITHAAVLRAALLATLGAPHTAFRRIDAPPLTILTLTSDTRRWALRGFVPPPLRASGG